MRLDCAQVRLCDVLWIVVMDSRSVVSFELAVCTCDPVELEGVWRFESDLSKRINFHCLLSLHGAVVFCGWLLLLELGGHSGTMYLMADMHYGRNVPSIAATSMV
jgi:hypothetical protein